MSKRIIVTATAALVVVGIFAAAKWQIELARQQPEPLFAVSQSSEPTTYTVLDAITNQTNPANAPNRVIQTTPSNPTTTS